MIGLSFAAYTTPFRFVDMLERSQSTDAQEKSTMPYKTLWFEVPVDHVNRDAGTFKVRVLLAMNDYINDDDAPLFVYTGNEGNIETLYDMVGWLTNPTVGIGSIFKAKIAFIEHRYYGQSQLPDNLRPFAYLSTSQVLWDYAYIIRKLKNSEEAKVVVFGGSYGGMLAAMFRLKYP
jgi:hypothetical protein